ncbi:hypothetical protein RI054_09g50250 [Pseudoscourfieldia marina]
MTAVTQIDNAGSDGTGGTAAEDSHIQEKLDAITERTDVFDVVRIARRDPKGYSNFTLKCSLCDKEFSGNIKKAQCHLACQKHGGVSVSGCPATSSSERVKEIFWNQILEKAKGRGADQVAGSKRRYDGALGKGKQQRRIKELENELSATTSLVSMLAGAHKGMGASAAGAGASAAGAGATEAIDTRPPERDAAAVVVSRQGAIRKTVAELERRDDAQHEDGLPDVVPGCSKPLVQFVDDNYKPALDDYFANGGEVCPNQASGFPLRNVLRKAGFAGRFSDRHAFGPGGAVYERKLKWANEVLAVPLANAVRTGGTLTEDGAKNQKRAGQNTTFVTPEACIFVRSHDITGDHKSQAYLTTHLIDSVEQIGPRLVFMVCTDGLKSQLNAAKKVAQKYHWIFHQRCATHGCNLLLFDLAKYFMVDIKLCLAIASFILNHDEIYGAFLELGLPMVKQEVDTRFASTTVAVESIVLVWEDLPSFFLSRKVQDYLPRSDKNYFSNRGRNATGPPNPPSAKVKFFVDELGNVKRKSRANAFLDVSIPFREFLRVTDSDLPHLHMVSKSFDASVMRSLEAAGEHLQNREDHLVGLVAHINTCVDKRRPDCVSPMALAASAVNPKYIYADDRYLPDGAQEALQEVISKYFGDDEDRANQARREYIELSELQANTWFGKLVGTKRVAKSFVDSLDEHSVQLFYAQADSSGKKCISEVARKLCSQVSGQGSSERANKDVARTRTKGRNRQSAETTNGLLKIKSAAMYQHRTASAEKDQQSKHRTFVEALAEQFSYVREEHARFVAAQEEREAANRLTAADEQSDDDDDENPSTDATNEDADEHCAMHEFHSEMLSVLDDV